MRSSGLSRSISKVSHPALRGASESAAPATAQTTGPWTPRRTATQPTSHRRRPATHLAAEIDQNLPDGPSVGDMAKCGGRFVEGIDRADVRGYATAHEQFAQLDFVA